jgi:hypothetical protein
MLSDLAMLAFVGVAALLLFGLVWVCDWLAR